MWRSLLTISSNIAKEYSILTTENVLKQQLRSTFVLKRKFPPRLHKKGQEPKKLKSKNYIYELVKDTSTEKQPEIDVILTSYIEGLGNSGDKVTLKQQYAYTNLILPGLAVYATPENIEKYKNEDQAENQERYSSRTAAMTLATLSRLSLSIVMNKHNPWTIKPWHIRASFRKSGYIVPEEAIIMPKKPISGPDMNVEGKEFLIQVKINKTETANVRCRIHHWSTDPTERLPYTPEFYKDPPQALFEEEFPVIKELYENKMKALNLKEKHKSIM